MVNVSTRKFQEYSILTAIFDQPPTREQWLQLAAFRKTLKHGCETLNKSPEQLVLQFVDSMEALNFGEEIKRVLGVGEEQMSLLEA